LRPEDCQLRRGRRSFLGSPRTLPRRHPVEVEARRHGQGSDEAKPRLVSASDELAQVTFRNAELLGDVDLSAERHDHLAQTRSEAHAATFARGALARFAG
jgi:hypothetical protein